jgi:hypothetical protein
VRVHALVEPRDVLCHLCERSDFSKIVLTECAIQAKREDISATRLAICGRGSSTIAIFESRLIRPCIVCIGNYVLDHLRHVTFLLFFVYVFIANNFQT